MSLAPAPPSAPSSQPPLELEPLRLPWDLSLTPGQFKRICQANPDAVLELDADGHLIAMRPTGGGTSRRNSELQFQLERFSREFGGWRVFDSSGGFRLPDGSVFSPDASLVREGRWQSLTARERRGFPPLCPDLVVDLRAPATKVHGG